MQSEKKIPSLTRRHIPKKGRWRRVAALYLVPLFALIGWLRLSEALRYQAYLLELNIWPRPLYFAVSGALLGVAFSLAWVFTLLKLKFYCSYSRILGSLFLVWFWTDRILYSTRTAFLNQLLVSLLISAITLLWMIWLVRKPDLPNKEAEHEQQN